MAKNISRTPKSHREDGVRVVVACSALKQVYRAILRHNSDIPLIMLYLQGSYEVILKRQRARSDHFMPSDLVGSQFDTLEEPVSASFPWLPTSECTDPAMTVSVDELSSDEIIKKVTDNLRHS